MSIIGSELLLGAADEGGYQIERSLRFNFWDTAYLNRTFSAAGDSQKTTISFWMKKNERATTENIFKTGSFPNEFSIRFVNTTDLEIYDYSSGGYALRLVGPKLRDHSAWYHIVVSIDTTQATSSDRAKFYINGVRITAFTTATYPPLNAVLSFNKAVTTYIGRTDANQEYLGAYLAEYQVVDGQALDPTSFGEFDDNGTWQPIAYAGSYGTNGFYLDFSDNSTTTALGLDRSGNGHNWTVNNFSVTPGATNDSLLDTPTSSGTDTGLGGELTGNFCTWNPISRNPQTGMRDGDLTATFTGSGGASRCNATMAVSSGKWYYEVTLLSAGTNDIYGIATGRQKTDVFPGGDTTSYGYAPEEGVRKYGGSSVPYGVTGTTGDTFMCAFDLDNNKLFYGKNGVWFNSSDPVTGANPAENLVAGTYYPVIRPYSSSYTPQLATNFGQRPFLYRAPSGYKCLCTTNLPEPTIADGSTVMDVALYTGNGSSQTISSLNFPPDFVWIKNRELTAAHRIFDTVRGLPYYLSSSTSDQEIADSNAITSFTSTGFSLGTSVAVNQNNMPYASWSWDAGSSTVTNNDGSVSSQVRANPSAGFSIVKFTGTGSNLTVGHGLGVAPKLIIVKRLDTGSDWTVGSNAIFWNYYLVLQSTAPRAVLSTVWQDTPPTSSVFYIGTRGAVNGAGSPTIAYCWAGVEGYSSIDSYTGTGVDGDGPFVYTGFKPRWILIKRFDADDEWIILDTERDLFNVTSKALYPNSGAVEQSYAYDAMDILSNGYKVRGGVSGINAAGGQYQTMAFAEHPLKYARAR